MAIKFTKEIEDKDGEVVGKVEMEVRDNETQIFAMLADGWKQVKPTKNKDK